MTDIKIKRYADKENLKKLVKYSKDTFAKVEHTHTKAEITDFPALATVATTGSYNDLLDKPTSFDVDLDNYYTKEQIDSMLESGSGGGGTGGGSEVGDATIKINYGSTNFGSFTTNQSADAIVDIRPINNLIRENYYIKSEVDDLLRNISNYGGNSITNKEIEEICVL